MIDTDFHNVHTPDAGRKNFEPLRQLKDRARLKMRQSHLIPRLPDSAFMTGTNIDINGGMLFLIA